MPNLANPNANKRRAANLKIKESHRLKALHIELNKMGQLSHYTEDTMKLKASVLHTPIDSFDSHKDHRMAMCLAPLAAAL